LKKFKYLNELCLSDNKLGRIGVKEIVEALGGCNVVKLDLSRNNIGRKGCKIIGPYLKKLKELEEFNIAYNSINLEGSITIMEALSELKIKKLNIRYNLLTHECTQEMCVYLRKLNELEELDIS